MPIVGLPPWLAQRIAMSQTIIHAEEVKVAACSGTASIGLGVAGTESRSDVYVAETFSSFQSDGLGNGSAITTARTQAGDYLVVCTADSQFTTPPTPPAGWTSAGIPITDHTGPFETYVWYLKNPAAQTTYTWTLPGGRRTIDGALVRGAHGTTLFDAVSSLATASGTSHASPSVVTTGTNRGLLAFNVLRGFPTSAWSQATNWTEYIETVGADAVTNMQVSLQARTAPTAGTYSDTFTCAIAEPAIVILLAVIPAFTPVILPKLATLTQNFLSTPVDWTAANSASVSGGLAILPCGSTYSSLVTTNQFDAIGSSAFIDVSELPAIGTGTTEAQFQVWFDVDNYLLIEKIGTTLLCRVRDSAVNTDNYLTYVPGTHRFWRIAESSGNAIFSTSADGFTWTTAFTVAHTMTTELANTQVRLGCGYYGTETTPGTFKVASVNIVEAVETGTTSVPLRSTGNATKSVIEPGTTNLATTTSGTAVKKAIQTGNCAAPLRATGSAVRIASPVGANVVALRSTGTGIKIAKSVGSATLALRDSSTATKTTLEVGTTTLAMTAVGAVTTGTARAQFGNCQVPLRTASTSIKIAQDVGTSRTALRSASTAIKIGKASSLNQFALRTVGGASKTAIGTATTTIAVTLLGQVNTAAARQQTGTAQVPLRGSGTSVKRAIAPSTCSIALRSASATIKLAVPTGAASLAVCTSSTTFKKSLNVGTVRVAMTVTFTVQVITANPNLVIRLITVGSTILGSDQGATVIQPTTANTTVIRL